MAEVIAEYHVHGRAYLRDDETGRFISAVKAGAHDAAWQLAETLAELIKGSIMGQGLFRTGELQGSVRAYMVGATEGAAVSDSDHAAPLEFGAVPHHIPGAFGLVQGVFHPGNRAYGFFKQGAEALAAMGSAIVAKNMP